MLAQIPKLIIRWQPPVYLLANLIPYLPEALHAFKYGTLRRAGSSKLKCNLTSSLECSQAQCLSISHTVMKWWSCGRDSLSA